MRRRPVTSTPRRAGGTFDELEEKSLFRRDEQGQTGGWAPSDVQAITGSTYFDRRRAVPFGGARQSPPVHERDGPRGGQARRAGLRRDCGIADARAGRRALAREHSQRSIDRVTVWVFCTNAYETDGAAVRE
ncbi:MAG: hypothetical protein IPG06_22950 [Haliea sp.]|nr:hypothetical protein [Haliea sp.]